MKYIVKQKPAAAYSSFSGGVVPTPAGTQLWANDIASKYCTAQAQDAQQLAALNAQITAAKGAVKDHLQAQLNSLRSAMSMAQQTITNGLSKYGYMIVGCKAVKRGEAVKTIKNSFVGDDKLVRNPHTGLWGKPTAIVKPNVNRHLGL